MRQITFAPEDDRLLGTTKLNIGVDLNEFQPTFYDYITTPHDAFLIFEAARNGEILQKVFRCQYDQEPDRLIKSPLLRPRCFHIFLFSFDAILMGALSLSSNGAIYCLEIEQRDISLSASPQLLACPCADAEVTIDEQGTSGWPQITIFTLTTRCT